MIPVRIQRCEDNLPHSRQSRLTSYDTVRSGECSTYFRKPAALTLHSTLKMKVARSSESLTTHKTTPYP